MHQPIYRIGQMICEMLIKRIRGEDLAEPYVLLRPSLVVRRSTVGARCTVGARSCGGVLGDNTVIPRKGGNNWAERRKETLQINP